MKLLLDTQIFIWWDSEPERLPQRLLALCEDPDNTLVLSVASVWEMQTRYNSANLTSTAHLLTSWRSSCWRIRSSYCPSNCPTFSHWSNSLSTTKTRLIG